MTIKPWAERPQPNRLEGRYEFPDYTTLRTFLDKAAELSEQTGLYPDLGFGTHYVNVTIYAVEEGGKLDHQQREFSAQLDQLAHQAGA